MLANHPPVQDQLQGEPTGEHTPQPAIDKRRLGIADPLAFAGGVGLVLVYALRGSGSYDTVVFGEHGLVVWWVLAIGIALGLLPRARPSRELLVLLGALLGYAAWTALSLSWSQSSELTSEELARTLSYLGVVALVGCVLDRRTWRSGALGLGFGAIVVCVLAVGGRLAPSVFPSDNLAATLGTDRLSYPFGYWNAVAAWAAMSTALGVGWSAHDGNRIRRAVALALVPFAGVAVYLSYSRAGVGGIAVAAVAVVAFSRNRFTATIHGLVAAAGTGIAILAVRGAPEIAHATGTKGAASVLGALAVAAGMCAAAALLTSFLGVDRWRLRGAMRRIAIAIALVALVPAAAVGVHYAHRAWTSFTRAPVVQTTDPTGRLDTLAGSRYPLWKSAPKAWEAHPFNGTGAGTWALWWNKHGTDGEYTRNTHNLWLENLAELGAPGLVLIIAVALAALSVALAVRRRARRSASAGAAAALAAALMVYLWQASVDWMWQSTAVTVLALAGVAAGAVRLSGGSWSPPRWLRAALAIAAAVIGAVQIPGLVSTVELRHSQAAAQSGNTALALSWARDAVSAEPWSASAWEQRALVEETAGELPQAADDERQAIFHEPTNYAHWLVMARIQTERGLLATGVRDLDQAQLLRPLANVFRLAPYLATPGHPFGVLP
jgi:hypothetical protein